MVGSAFLGWPDLQSGGPRMLTADGLGEIWGRTLGHLER